MARQKSRVARGQRIEQLRSGLLDPLDKRTKAGKARADRREFMEKARKTFELWSEADEPQREREIEDERFYAGEHWPEDVKIARAGQNASNGLPPIPARPCLVFDKLSEPVNQILNVERDADLGIELTPADDFEGLGVQLDETEITLREGLIRRIQRESQAATARSWAFKRAVVAGRGWYGVMTRFTPGKTFDQEIYVEGFYNQSCVTPDPTHEQPDGSDLEGGFVGRWIPWKEYKARWPDAADKRNVISTLRDSDFIALGDEAPKWFKIGTGKDKNDDDLRMVYIVDYYYTVHTSRELCLLNDGSVEWTDELPDAWKSRVMDRRDVIQTSVKWAKLDGANPEPLEETDWPGPDIPIVKVIGEEVLPYDDERRVMGIVRPAKDPSYGFDAMGSKLVEVVANAPIPNVMMAAGQDEGFEKEWNLSTTRTLGRLHFNQVDSEGRPAGPPSSVPREVPIQPIAMSLSMFDEAVQTGTRSHDPALGKVDPTLRSGKAITEVVNRSKEGTSNFLDNLKRSIRYEAQILNNLLYPIYGSKPGRLAKIITGEGKPQTIMLGQPFTMNGTRPQGVQIPHPDDPTQTLPAPMGHPNLPPNAQQFQLSEYANCNIAIIITKSAETRRQEATAFFSSVIQAEPQLISVFGDLAFKYSDMAGHEEAEARAKLMLAPPIQAAEAAKKTGQPPIPPQVQQQLQMAEQAMQKAQQEIAELQQKIAAKEVETQGKIAIAQSQHQTDLQTTQMNNETKIAVAELSATVERLALFLEERARIGAHITDVTKTVHDKAHEIGTKAVDHALASNLSAQEHNQALVEQGQAHQHALAEGAQAAALAPEPSSGSDGS